MAYTIISQNNNTTTLSDGVNTITVPSRVNLTSGNFTIVEVNNNMATLEDGDGNVYRDIPCVATLAGEGGGGGSGLPDQTGHSGEFLTTDGSSASWSAISALQNTATGTYALTILGTPTTGTNATNIGVGSSCLGGGVSVGKDAQGNGSGNTCIGRSAKGWSYNSIAIGTESKASETNSIAIGRSAYASATYAIQLGCYNNTTATNSDANTFKVANQNGNFEIMDANGNLPADRLASTTGLADGNYRLRLTMTNGVPTLSWVAE